jgi:hypothetical protein
VTPEKTMRSSFRSRSAYTLIELSITMLVIVVMGGVVYSVVRGAMIGFAQNYSLNQTGNQSRSVANYVERALEGAVDEPELVELTSGQLVKSTSTYANGIRFHKLRPAFYKITGPINATTNGLSYTTTTTTSITVNVVANNTASLASSAPAAGDRIFFLVPNDITPETVASGTSPGKKQGRGISAVTLTGASSSPFTATLTIAQPAKTVLCNNPCFIATECAFISRVVGTGTQARRELHFLPSTSDLTLGYRSSTQYNTLVTRDLDAAPTATDSGGTTVLPFKIVALSANDKRVQVDLSMRVMDYVGTLSLGPKPTIGTSGETKDEFFSFARTTLTIPLRNRGMLPPLSTL